MGKLRSFAKLSLRDHFVFLEAAAAMGFARILIRFVPLRHWASQIAQENPAGTVNDSKQASISRIARAINRVSRNCPVQFICLPQALAARWMLKRRGIVAQLFIGTHKTQTLGADHTFHAWLKFGDLWVTGQCNAAEYAVFSQKTRGE